ncbi:hypothetical protein D9619_011857 [Psilocybe cf. subviscida]|uniref:VHS domain-containing protein n=1 Tax=Psilocybe cf. subviscida TaxID=2480587 RepID=A0A8H5B0H0_9AGAR|nr:hypothetical protein D9619_011857 [Psilocybe cf. subviscida]
MKLFGQHERNASENTSAGLYTTLRRKPVTHNTKSAPQDTQDELQDLFRQKLPPVIAVAEYPTSSDSGHGHSAEKTENRGFWGSNKDKYRDWEREREWERQREQQRKRERERDKEIRPPRQQKDPHRKDALDKDPKELTRMIGYLTATGSEDCNLVLEVCKRASSSESNAKQAIRALRCEFKYGRPLAQLSAARLWMTMLQHSSETFISQSTSRKFLDTVEETIQSSRTSPVVRERLLEVVAAAAYASYTKNDLGFKGLWKRVKPRDQPDEGVPFYTDDAIFTPPASRPEHLSESKVLIIKSTPLSDANNGPSSPPAYVALPTAPTTDPQPRLQPQPESPTQAHKHNSKRSSSAPSHHIITREEDIQRVFRECNTGQGNAALLSQLVALGKPEDLEKQTRMKEFLAKSRSSQEFIFAQIPSGSAGAERSRVGVDNQKTTDDNEAENGHGRKRMSSKNDPVIVTGGKTGALETGERNPPLENVDETTEERLLSALFAADGDLVEALKQHDDLARIAMERKTEERRRREARRALKQQLLTADTAVFVDWAQGVEL